jgi:hypothetical protein
VLFEGWHCLRPALGLREARRTGCRALTQRQCPRTVEGAVVPSLLPAALGPLPPWLVLSGLLGIINAAACFMLVGRTISRLAWYAVLGIFASGLGQVVGSALQAPQPLKIGDLNVLAASVGAWTVLLAARLARF